MGGYAWVTLATNDSYSLGALVLAHSLKQAGTQQQLAVLVTPGVTSSMRGKLRQVFNVVQEVNILDSKDEANLRLLKRPELGITFTKLHCWRLTQFDKCVFLDADTLVLENCDELFEREELSAAPDVGWPDCFNSGVFVYRPSNETYEKLVQFALEKGSFDGGDQGLLNLYFSDWAHKDISKHLPFIYNMCSTACYSYLPAFKQFGTNAKIIHFIGATKPWLQYFDTETKKVHPSGEAHHLQDVLQRWWNIFCSLIHPNLTTDMSHTDTVFGSPSNFRETPHQTSHYVHTHHIPTPDIPNLADDYQNVWDPWEEYDLKQSQIQSDKSTFGVSHIVHSPQGHKDVGQFFESHSHMVVNQNNSFETHTQSYESHSQSFETHGREEHKSYEIPSSSVVRHQSFSEPKIHREHSPPLSVPEHHIHETQSIESSQNQPLESHNTNAHYDAGHYDSYGHQHDNVVVDVHNYQSPIPVYQYYTPSQPTALIEHYYPPTPKPVMTESPPLQKSQPRLPDDSITTTTVSTEIALHASTKEEGNDNNSGLAGAFAQLTLGTPRTLEQAALDDHLRRQGWEVGNIDYLGRDSFDNIWSKICETLAAAPEPPAPKTKAPSPPAESEVKVPEESAPEAISKKKLSQSVQETQPEVQSELVKEEPAVPEKVESQGAELEPSSEPALAPTPETPAKAEETLSKPEIALEQTKPDAAPMEAPEPKPAPLPLPESPKPIPESPRDTPVPLPESPKPISESPRDASVPLPESPKPNPKSHRDAPIPLPESPKSLADTALTSAPILLPESPKPLKVALESPKFIPGTVPESSKPAPEAVPESSKVVPEAAFESPEPAPETATESLTTVSGAVPEISKPTPEAVPKSQKPVAEIGSETSKPVELAPESPKLVPEKTRESPRSAPETFPESPKPTTVVPESPKPVPEVAPEISKPAPEVVTENSKVQSPKPTAAPESLKPKAAPESPKTTAAPKSAKPAAAPESPKPATESVLDSKKAVKTEKKIKPAAEEAVKAPENPKLEPAPQTCPVAPKSGAEKKTSSKKLKEAAQPPKAEVTEATPPSTPVSPQPKQTKQALVVETSTPDTPPPTSSEASGATPTPPPRKGSGAPKKTVTKSKK